MNLIQRNKIFFSIFIVTASHRLSEQTIVDMLSQQYHISDANVQEEKCTCYKVGLAVRISAVVLKITHSTNTAHPLILSLRFAAALKSLYFFIEESSKL